MSLKARIEAVIYAAEEPVTLAQLASLFRDEAAASRAERLAQPDAPPEDAAVAIAPQPPGEPEASPAPEPSATESLDAAVPPVPQQGTPEAAAALESPADAPGEMREAPLEVPGDPAREARLAQRAADREIRDELRRIVDELIADYASAGRGLEIREVAGGYRMATRAEYHDAVRAFVKTLKPPMKLSLQALETLAVIAYKQPITAPEIGDIRGVDSSGVLGSLIARKLITTAGRKQVIGRPILYKTTREFLLRFGLKDLNELPSIEEFEKMASELAESEDASAAAAEEPPLAQNELAEIEENSLSDPQGDPSPAKDPTDPTPPLEDPQPEAPPISEPPAEPEPAPPTTLAASAEESQP